MRAAGLIGIAALLAATPVLGCEQLNESQSLDRLLHLVEQHHPVRVAAREEQRLQSRPMPWRSELALSYATDTTDTEAAGANATELRELDTQRAFWRDRLSFQQQRVDEGLDESVTLWQFVEKARQAEFEFQRDKGALAASVMTLSRQYGGKAWKQLQDLLGAMLN